MTFQKTSPSGEGFLGVLTIVKQLLFYSINDRRKRYDLLADLVQNHLETRRVLVQKFLKQRTIGDSRKNIEKSSSGCDNTRNCRHRSKIIWIFLL